MMIQPRLLRSFAVTYAYIQYSYTVLISVIKAIGCTFVFGLLSLLLCRVIIVDDGRCDCGVLFHFVLFIYIYVFHLTFLNINCSYLFRKYSVVSVDSLSLSIYLSLSLFVSFSLYLPICLALSLFLTISFSFSFWSMCAWFLNQLKRWVSIILHQRHIEYNWLSHSQFLFSSSCKYQRFYFFSLRKRIQKR